MSGEMPKDIMLLAKKSPFLMEGVKLWKEQNLPWEDFLPTAVIALTHNNNALHETIAQMGELLVKQGVSCPKVKEMASMN